MNNPKGAGRRPSANQTALSATIHCLTGCAIGEILGMILGNSLGWGNWATIGVSVVLAFVFGYSLTLLPLIRSGLGLKAALVLAFASDTLSITVMEIVDNAIMLVIPGAMDAAITSVLFWGAMVASLMIAGLVAFPVNRWLIMRGRGHAKVHAHRHGERSSKVAVPDPGAEPVPLQRSSHEHH